MDLTAWYTGRRGRSGPDQLRGAADQALGQLLSNAETDARRRRHWGVPARRPAEAGHLVRHSRHGYLSPALRRRVRCLPDPARDPRPEEDNAVPARPPRGGTTTRSGRAPEPARTRRPLRPRANLTDPRPGAHPRTAHRPGARRDERKRLAAAELCAVGHLNGAQVSPAASSCFSSCSPICSPARRASTARAARPTPISPCA